MNVQKYNFFLWNVQVVKIANEILTTNHFLRDFQTVHIAEDD